MPELLKSNLKSKTAPEWIRYQAIAIAVKEARNPCFSVVVWRGDSPNMTWEVTQYENFDVARKFFQKEQESPAYLIYVW